MGNENQVRALIENSKHVLLREESKTIGQSTGLYNLETEFGKTKSNKRFLFHLIWFSFVVGIILGSVIGSLWIENRSKKIPIDIQDFQDLRLRELLSSASRGNGEIQNLQVDIKSLRDEKSAKIRLIHEKAQHERGLLAGLNDTDSKNKLAQITKNESIEVASTESSYTKKIEDKESRVKTLEANSGVDPKSAGDDSLVNNGDKLMNLRIQKVKDTYEERIAKMQALHAEEMNALFLKYNPVYAPGDKALAALTTKINPTGEIAYSPYDPQLEKETGINQQAFKKLRESTSNELLLVKRLRQVPYANSINPSLEKIEGTSQNLIATYESLWSKLNASLKNKKEVVGSFELAMQTYARDRSDNGYVLDSRVSDKIALFIDPIHVPQAGAKANIFRQDNDLVGTIELFMADGRWWGKNPQLAEGKRLLPFDRLFVIKN
jgi:hypothetical protein